MIGEVIVIGDLQLRDGASVGEHDRLGRAHVRHRQPSSRLCVGQVVQADDGEELTVFRFASEEALEAWRTHPEHVETMKRGHAEFYASGFLQICKVIREVGPFEHA